MSIVRCPVCNSYLDENEVGHLYCPHCGWEDGQDEED